VHTEAREYAHTREWARWLRGQAPWAKGFIWLSKRDLAGHSVILFGDRCGAGDLAPDPAPPRDLGDCPGIAWVNEQLADYGAAIRRPSRCL
jgi:hypothetical protein